uniref:Phospholipase A1 member A n=1 Tax=Xiphophorus couchianus TaxID=32473 RepID=A0A3B5MIZ0_9TELE
MHWEDKAILFSILLVYTSGESQEDGQCAELNNTRWQEYRQQRVEVQYLLLTRKNPDCAQKFDQDSVGKPTSYFNTSRQTKVIIHGFSALGRRPSWVTDLAQALLEAQDANVVVVDWIYGASFAYNLVVENYKEVALQISVLVNQLQRHGCRLESFHLIGVSLGAHVAGFVGTVFEGKIGRITGLDPAGPMFKGADTYDRLDPTDAVFVDAIHTDSDHFGISIPVGHVDFFLNGGMDQTGCARSRFASMYGYVICDHMRALHVYMSALNGTCQLMGIPCASYEDFLKGSCVDCGVFKGRCPAIGKDSPQSLTHAMFKSLDALLYLCIMTLLTPTLILPVFHLCSLCYFILKNTDVCDYQGRIYKDVSPRAGASYGAISTTE